MAISIDELNDGFDVETLDSNQTTEEVKTLENDPLEETLHDPEDETTTVEEDNNVTSQTEEEPSKEGETVDVIASLLKSKGIDDPSKIKFVDDNNEVKEVAWDDLSPEEQLNILQNNDTQVEDNYGLDDNEIDLINRLRLSNMTPEEFVATIKQLGVAEYMAQNQAPQQVYSVDDLTDDELYVLDLQARVGQDNITEDELQEALDRAKSNEALFAKEIAGLREEYHRLEDDKNQKDAALAQQQAQENFERYAYGVIDAINKFDALGELNVDMDDDDKNLLYTFLTGSDNAGVSYLQKALNDPETLVQMAWFALKGEDVINSISDYYKSEITKAHRAGYDEGVKKTSAKLLKQIEPKVVVKKPETKEVNKRMSIDDIDW